MGERIPIPDEIAWDLINLAHRYLLHFGMDKVLDFLERYFYIKSVDRLTRDVVASCHVCEVTKYYTRATVVSIITRYQENLKKRYQWTFADRCHKRRNNYILVLYDHYSKLTKLYPIKNQKLDTICDVLRDKYLPEVGTPEKILTDKGGQFGSDRWKAFGREHDFEVRHILPYNPQSNLVERAMREINRVLRGYAHGRHTT